MENLKAYKFPILIIFLSVIFSAIVLSQNLIKNANQIKSEMASEKEPTVQDTKESISSKLKTGDSEVKIDVNNSLNQNPTTNSNQNGTCKVTRNGVTEIVPADQVNVNESSSGDITVKVECDNTSSSNTQNSSSKTSINNKIDVKVNTSN